MGVEGYTLCLDLNTSEHFGPKPHQSRGKGHSLSFNSFEGSDNKIQLLKCDGSSHLVLKYSFSKQLLSGQNLPRKWDFWSNFCLCLKKFNPKSLTLSQEYWLFCACVPGLLECIFQPRQSKPECFYHLDWKWVYG